MSVFETKPYVYNGTKREGLPDLEAVNAEIMAAREGQGPRLALGFAPSGDTCRKGHPRTEATTTIRADGTRRCRTCDQRRSSGRTDRAA